jgi:hypothetical protein
VSKLVIDGKNNDGKDKRSQTIVMERKIMTKISDGKEQ